MGEMIGEAVGFVLVGIVFLIILFGLVDLAVEGFDALICRLRNGSWKSIFRDR